MGPTNPVDALPVRSAGDFATEIGENIVHGSDAPESAARELKLSSATDVLDGGPV